MLGLYGDNAEHHKSHSKSIVVIKDIASTTHNLVVSTNVNRDWWETYLQTISRECFSMRHGAAGMFPTNPTQKLADTKGWGMGKGTLPNSA